jgi:4-hydroxy-tetrahydrodipicolinate synthase
MNVMHTENAASTRRASHAKLGGLLAFLITPTSSDETIDETRLCELADDVIAGGADVLTLFGSTGSIGSFAETERKRAAEVLIKHVKGRVPVMVGTGAMTTQETIRLSQHAEQVGASAVLVVPITYWILSDAEVIGHFTALGRSIHIPICVYNNPRLTGVDILPPVIAKLAEIPNVQYLKESSPELGRVALTKRLLGDHISIFAGRDNTAVEAMRIGADGWASAVANFCPSVCKTILNLAADPKKADKAWDLSQKYMSVFDFCLSKGLVRSCHAAMDILGKPAGVPRLPLLPLGKKDVQHLAKLLEASAIGRMS